ncbi:uncharacterized protein V6R79_018426 [Siganus canaliculatus]
MDSLTESEMSEIPKEERNDGVQRLSRHFSWPEFCDERQCFHQEFVYDVAMFAVSCGFPWNAVIEAAVIAKRLFPQLGLDVPSLFVLLLDMLAAGLPNLTPVQQYQFTNFLTITCTTKRRLFQAVADGVTDTSVSQLHLEVKLPPTPLPLSQGMDVEEWERRQAELMTSLSEKEEELKVHRDRSKVTLEELNLSENKQLAKEEILKLARSTLNVTEDQILTSLDQEASMLSDILGLKLQLETAKKVLQSHT